MSAALVSFVGVMLFSLMPAAQSFMSPIARFTCVQKTYGSARTASPSSRVAPEDAHTRARCPPPYVARIQQPLSGYQPLWGRLHALSAEATTGGGGGGNAEDGAGGEDVSVSREEDTEGGATARKPAEPVGSAGAMEDDMLVELVGQDYGMMALLRNDKFKGLIVLLRNVPPSEWVAEVARTYPGDDEVKGMLGQVGKLMKMMDYYMAKKPKQ